MKTLKNLIATGIIGASLTFGAGNQLKAQEENVKFYNHDEDEFPEEIICWKKEGFNETTQKPNYNEAILTIIYYSDKDDDNFYENIRVLNCTKTEHKLTYIENFYIDKNTGLMDYNRKCYFITRNWWEKNYSQKNPAEIAKNPPTQKWPKVMQSKSFKENYHYLTKEEIYSLFPRTWNSYGGFGERVKKIINAGIERNQDDIKSIVEIEKNNIKNNNYQNPYQIILPPE